MQVKNHRLTGADHSHKSPNKSGKITPRIIVLHYTASGGADGSGDASYLSRAKARASAQVVVGRKGGVWQLMGLNEKAWHAGSSKWKGVKNVNNFSIGIEIDNWGWLDSKGRAWSGTQVPAEFQFKATRGGKHNWELYRPEQLASVEKVIAAICAEYDIDEIVGHEDVSPGRKQDPGPALDQFMIDMNAKYCKGDRNVVRDETSTTKVKLNLREEPHTGGKLITTMPKGEFVKVLSTDKYGWARVTYKGKTGYCAARYLR